MGCQCAKINEENENELKKDSDEGMNDVFKEDNNLNDKEELFGLNNEEENNEQRQKNPKLKGSNNKNNQDEDYIERLTEEQNIVIILKKC